MNKDELNMISFEIVSYSGEARSKLLTALEKAKNKDFAACDQLVEEAGKALIDAHDAQMDVMQQEAQGNGVEMGFIMVHAQDHLMTTLLFKDIIGTLIDVYKR